MREDGAYARAISRFIIQALNNRDVTVYEDGSQTRSFSFASDTSIALLLMLTSERAEGEVLNVGNRMK